MLYCRKRINVRENRKGGKAYGKRHERNRPESDECQAGSGISRHLKAGRVQPHEHRIVSYSSGRKETSGFNGQIPGVDRDALKRYRVIRKR